MIFELMLVIFIILLIAFIMAILTSKQNVSDEYDKRQREASYKGLELCEHSNNSPEIKEIYSAVLATICDISKDDNVNNDNNGCKDNNINKDVLSMEMKMAENTLNNQKAERR